MRTSVPAIGPTTLQPLRRPQVREALLESHSFGEQIFHQCCDPENELGTRDHRLRTTCADRLRGWVRGLELRNVVLQNATGAASLKCLRCCYPSMRRYHLLCAEGGALARKMVTRGIPLTRSSRPTPWLG